MNAAAELVERIEMLERRLAKNEHGESIEAIKELLPKMVNLLSMLSSGAAKQHELHPIWWPETVPADAEVAWHQIQGWVDEIRVRYPDSAGADIRPCWFAHAEVLDNLTALQRVWVEAWSANAPSTAAMDWFDRHLPGALRRVRQITQSCANGCKVMDGVRQRDISDEARTAWVALNLL